jgi:hypothetical protein
MYYLRFRGNCYESSFIICMSSSRPGAIFSKHGCNHKVIVGIVLVKPRSNHTACGTSQGCGQPYKKAKICDSDRDMD